jgi:calcineurin-like phosphoesterase family protein
VKVYLITDTHFYHDKMVEYCGRPVDHTEIIGKELITVSNTLASYDVIFHLGDVCVGNDEEAHRRFIEPIKCKKWLIRGNHDSKSNNWYLQHGWDWVGEVFIDTYFGKKIVFSHTPYKIPDDCDLNIHGHFHNQLPRLLEKKFVVSDEEYRNKHDLANLTPKHKLLALEYTDYKPVLLEDFVK